MAFLFRWLLRLATLVNALKNLGVAAPDAPPQDCAPEAEEDEEDFDDEFMDSDVLAELSLAFAGEELARLLSRAAAEIESGAGRLPALAQEVELPELQAAIHKLAGTAGLVGARALHQAGDRRNQWLCPWWWLRVGDGLRYPDCVG